MQLFEPSCIICGSSQSPLSRISTTMSNGKRWKVCLCDNHKGVYRGKSVVYIDTLFEETAKIVS